VREQLADIEAVTAITEAIRQSVEDLDVEVERINAAREAMPPPIDRAPKRGAAKQPAAKAGRLKGLEGRTWTG